jgi:pimeloyl-ACP methyl ester carboxylesterase
MLINILHRLIRYRFRRLGFKSEFLDLESCRLHFFRRVREKNAKHIVFIHGLGTSSSTWIKILSSLDRSSSITCVDLPGHGFSRIKHGLLFLTLEQFDDTIEQFIHHTQHHPIILIGHSLGGWLAARFAISHPEAVQHLILMNNAGIYYSGIEQQAEVFDIQKTKDARRLIHRMWFRSPWYFALFTSSIFHSLRKKRVSEFVASVREEDFLNSTLPTLSMPVDVIWGEEDRLISKQSVEIMKQLLPQVKEHWIPQCGHVPQLERPRELSSVLKRLLASSRK